MNLFPSLLAAVGALQAASPPGAVAPASPAPDNRGVVVVCYLRQADLNVVDKADPGKLTLTGPHRLLVLRFPVPVGDHVDGNDVKVWDPTHVLLERQVEVVSFKGDSMGVLMKGSPSDALAMVALKPATGKLSGQAYVTRAEKNKPLSYEIAGACGPTLNENADVVFENWKKQPETHQ